MRKGIIGRAAGVGALAIASMLGGAQASQPLVAHTQTQAQNGEIKATREHRKSKEAINVNIDGGLVFPPVFNDFGMSPKEYGLRFGTGASRKNKSNRLRYSHNAKLRRRAK